MTRRIETGLVVALAFLLLGQVLRLTRVAALESSNQIPGTPPCLLNKSVLQVEGEFPSSGLYSCEIAAGTDRFVRLHIGIPGIKAAGAVYAPDGQKLRQFQLSQRVPSKIDIITKSAGRYRIEIKSSEASVETTYILTLEILRPLMPHDGSRVSANEAVLEGDSMRAEWSAQSLLESAARYEYALKLYKQAGERHEEVRILTKLGDVSLYRNDPRRALEHYAAALSALGRRPYEDIGEVYNGIGYVYLSLGENQKALEYFNKSLKKKRPYANQGIEAQALNNVGETYYALGDLRKALHYFEQALTIWRSLKDREGQALALKNSGDGYSGLSDTQKATSYYDQSLTLWREAGNQWGEAHTLTSIGHLKSKLGEKQAAINLYKEAMPLFERMADKVGEGFILNGMGYVYDELGESKIALDNHEKALLLFQAANYREGEAGALLRIGEVNFTLKDYPQALKNFQQALYTYRVLGFQLFQSYTLRDMGMVYEALGEPNKALNYYWQALRQNRTNQDRRWQAYTYNNIAHANETLGRKQDALKFYNRALLLNRASEDQFGEATSLFNIAKLEWALNRLETAKSRMEAAFQIAESLRTGVASQDLRASYLASVHQHYESYVDLLMEMHKKDHSGGFSAAAFGASEKARARTLIESLREARTNIREGVNSSLLNRELYLESELNAKAQLQSQLINSDREAEAQVIANEINQLTIEWSEVRGQIRSQSPRYAALTQPQPLTLSEIQQVLDDDSVLLEYMLGDERSYVWAVSPRDFSSYELPGRAEIERAAREVHSSLTANQPLPDETFEQRQARVTKANQQLPFHVANLSKILIAPVADKLGTKRLLIVPDGALQYIPFQILNKGTEPRPLVINYEIIYEPSASALALLVSETKNRKQASDSVAVLADPVFESDDPRLNSSARASAVLNAQVQEPEFHQALRDVNVSGDGGRIPRLHASRDEAEAIMSVAPWRSGFQAVGFEASRATVMKGDFSNYRIVHFATHGLLNNEHPELSGIVLSLFDKKGQPEDGFLRLHDIYNLKLPVELVVLSACNTGLGKDVKGEGLIGLTRGFMYAGASSVVASLWKVDDEATAELMRLFYGYMLRDGLSPAAALRKAQVTMSQQKRWQSPYYWAGFVIQGQYIQNERTSHFSIPHLALWLFGAAVVSAAALYALKRRRKISL